MNAKLNMKTVKSHADVINDALAKADPVIQSYVRLLHEEIKSPFPPKPRLSYDGRLGMDAIYGFAYAIAGFPVPADMIKWFTKEDLLDDGLVGDALIEALQRQQVSHVDTDLMVHCAILDLAENEPALCKSLCMKSTEQRNITEVMNNKWMTKNYHITKTGIQRLNFLTAVGFKRYHEPKADV